MRTTAWWVGLLYGLLAWRGGAELWAQESVVTSQPTSQDGSVTAEKLAGKGVWIDPAFQQRFRRTRRVRATIWFEDQLLGDGQAYRRRAREWSGWKRTDLRKSAVHRLKAIHSQAWTQARGHIERLVATGKISQVEPHWIVNGFSCLLVEQTLENLKSIPGVRKVFASPRQLVSRSPPLGEVPAFLPRAQESFAGKQYKHPWYIHALQADRVWQTFGVTGTGTLNVIQDFNFVFSDNLAVTLYRNPGELPANGKDDDGNGLVDDYHGYDFDRDTAVLTNQPVPPRAKSPSGMHGFMCAAIISGRGLPGKPYEFGIAPESRWAGVIGGGHLERSVQWAIEQGADTYSMSFSIPGLGEYRSHWRKLMEQGTLCGIFFVSGAGNFAQTAQRPVQMRIPEDIPDVVFAAAGVQRNFQRTPFSSQGPVQWQTDHYRDGLVQKPEVCAFNMGLPLLHRDGSVQSVAINGNSFAGPMFCGTIALMLSADPDLLPWDLKVIITETATDVGTPGVDDQTGHGLINTYRAVREVLRRKAIRLGNDPGPYTGREPGDELDITAEAAALTRSRLELIRVIPGSEAARVGVRLGDIPIRYDNTRITKVDDLRSAVSAVGEQQKKLVSFVVMRQGKEIEFMVQAGQLGVKVGFQYLAPVFK